MRLFLFAVLTVAPAFAQITDLATDRTGSTLLFVTRFRLQTEADVFSQQKIYRYQNNAWSRLTFYEPSGLIPGGIDSPFVVGDGSTFGWSLMPGHGLFPPIRIHPDAVVNGLTLPGNFPREHFRVSSNGRYAVGRTIEKPAEWFDSVTGTRTVLAPEAQYPYVADDGSYAYSTTAGAVIYASGGTTRTMAAAGRLEGLTADGRWTLIVGDDGLTRICATFSGALAAILPTPPPPSYALWTKLSNAGYLYLTEQRRKAVLWDASTGALRVLFDSPEPLADAALSVDGSTAWISTSSNRLIKFNVRDGVGQVVLPSLGHNTADSIEGARGPKVPGSAVLLPGTFTRDQKVTVDGDPWPLSDVNANGYWAQIPWEWRGAGVKQTLRVRTDNHPFEDVASVGYSGTYLPAFTTRQDSTGFSWILAAHQDFGGIVSADDPARGGETLHVYMTGLGALQSGVPTGVPGPMNAVKVARDVRCFGYLLGTQTTFPVAVPSAIYAPGMIGIYQVDVTLPPALANGPWGLACGDGSQNDSGSLWTRP